MSFAKNTMKLVDKPLRMSTASNDYYYAHDHLYNVSALIGSAGDAVEYYEYDAYGKVTAITDKGNGTWWDGDETTATSSALANPYLFTGRRLDILDNSSLKIQYSRHRYYHPKMGRFLQQDPLGVTPNPTKPNRFNIQDQYKDGMNIYEYAISNPVINLDHSGLKPCSECWSDWDAARKRVLEGSRECHKDCGHSTISIGAPLCVISCAKSGPFIKVCLAACWGAEGILFSSCHLMCARQTSENYKSITFARDLCLKKCCD